MEKTKTFSKRLVAIMLSLAMVFSLVQGGIFTASAETSGDFEYSVLADNSVEITKYNGLATELTIPSTLGGKTVTSIKEAAFYNCISLTSVIIPDSVKSIGDYAFWDCTSLTSITISNSVKSIGKNAFERCASLTSVEIANSVESIGEAAFERCISLTSIVIPDSVKVIGDAAFIYCGSLTNITVAEDNANYSDINGVLFTKDKTELVQYPIGKTDASYTIPDSVKSIGDGAFVGCVSLTSVIIPDSVNSIGDGAFGDCTSLTSITISNSVKSIGKNAFERCASLTSVEIANSVESIGDYAFDYCTSLTSIVIPNSVKSIGEGAFLYCESLTNITVAEDNANYSDINGVLFTKDKTELVQYPIGKTDASYTIPDSVKSIGDGAFFGCDSLNKVTIGKGVKRIGSYAFAFCDSLKSVTIGKGVNSIGDYAFDYCTSLTSVTIPDSVESIGESAFLFCKSLNKVTIGKGVKRIGSYAFAGCDALKSVNYLGSKEQWDKIAIAQGNGVLSKVTVSICKHSNTTTKHKKSATYFVKGYSGDTYCNTCKKVVKKGKAIAKKTLKKPTVKVTAGKKQIKIKYTKVSGATGFQVQYKKGKKTVTKIFNTKKSVTKAIKKLAKGRYKVKVRAFVKSGTNKAYSKWTKTKNITIK